MCCSSRLWRRRICVHEAGRETFSYFLKIPRHQRLVSMAGVFDIDLDQPEENVSDEELEEVNKEYTCDSMLCAAKKRQLAS